MLKYVKEKLLDFYFANRREQFVLPAPWCASFRHEGNYNGGDAAAGSPPCIGRENGRVDLISELLPFGRLWYGEPNAISNAIGYATFYSRSHDAVIRVYDEAGNVAKTHGHAGDFKGW